MTETRVFGCIMSTTRTNATVTKTYNWLLSAFADISWIIDHVYQKEKNIVTNPKLFVMRIFYWIQVCFRITMIELIMADPPRFIDISDRFIPSGGPKIACKQLYDAYFKPDEIPHLYFKILHMNNLEHPQYYKTNVEHSKLYLRQIQQCKLSKLSLIYQQWEHQHLFNISPAETQLFHV